MDKDADDVGLQTRLADLEMELEESRSEIRRINAEKEALAQELHNQSQSKGRDHKDKEEEEEELKKMIARIRQIEGSSSSLNPLDEDSALARSCRALQKALDTSSKLLANAGIEREKMAKRAKQEEMERKICESKLSLLETELEPLQRIRKQLGRARRAEQILCETLGGEDGKFGNPFDLQRLTRAAKLAMNLLVGIGKTSSDEDGTDAWMQSLVNTEEDVRYLQNELNRVRKRLIKLEEAEKARQATIAKAEERKKKAAGKNPYATKIYELDENNNGEAELQRYRTMKDEGKSLSENKINKVLAKSPYKAVTSTKPKKKNTNPSEFWLMPNLSNNIANAKSSIPPAPTSAKVIEEFDREAGRVNVGFLGHLSRDTHK